MGDPKDPDTFCGALISHNHMDKVIGYIVGARQAGAKIQCGHGVVSLDLPEHCRNVRKSLKSTLLVFITNIMIKDCS